jgi:hypothetical protein
MVTRAARDIALTAQHGVVKEQPPEIDPSRDGWVIVWIGDGPDVREVERGAQVISRYEISGAAVACSEEHERTQAAGPVRDPGPQPFICQSVMRVLLHPDSLLLERYNTRTGRHDRPMTSYFARSGRKSRDGGTISARWP